jgi:hypothetical protein
VDKRLLSLNKTPRRSGHKRPGSRTTHSAITLGNHSRGFGEGVGSVSAVAFS